MNNSAVESGDNLYGGKLETCYTCGSVIETAGVSSDPYRVCICESNHPDCDKSVVSVAAVGQLSGMVPSE